jgi:hypothetical protein
MKFKNPGTSEVKWSDYQGKNATNPSYPNLKEDVK